MEHKPENLGEQLTKEMQLEPNDKVFIGGLIDTLADSINKHTSQDYRPAKESLEVLIGSLDREDLSGALLAVDVLIRHLDATGPGSVPEHHDDMRLRAEAIKDFIEKHRELSRPLVRKK